MEFRYRSIDGDRPPIVSDTTPTQSPNQSFSFLSAQPIARSSEDHVREAIEREIEKEQIRQEIIVAETMRRRELIAEVVQEMATEREMAKRRVAGMSLEDKLTMWINQKKLLSNQIQNNNFFRQNQNPMYTGPCNLFTSPMMQSSPLEQIAEATGAKVTSTMQTKKDKLIKLNRPDAIGEKRKAEDTQTDHVRTKRKADGVGLARDPNFLGPENKAKEILMSAETGEIVSSKPPSCSGKLGSGKQVESKSKLRFKFWCDICGVGTFCQTVMRSHELGKKHIAAIKQQTVPHETASTSITITHPPQLQAPHETASTSITIIPPPQLEVVAVPESADAQDQQKVDETVAKETDEKKKKARFLCELCNIQTHSEQMMETHRLGRKHKVLLKKQQKALNNQQNELQAVAEDTNVITVPVISLDADPGEKMVEAAGVKVTSHMESNKDKLIELNRPDAIGAKRKTEDTQTGHVRAKRKADGVGLARDPNLVGPESKEKEIALKEKLMSAEIGETVSLKLPPCSGIFVSGKQVESKSKLMFKFWCDICGVGAHSQTVMRSHELGKKHIAAIKQQNETLKTASTSMITTPPLQSETVLVPENADVQDQQKVDETAGKETDEKKKMTRFWCEICNIETYSEQMMETHRLGKKHIAAIKQQNEPPETASTSIIISPPPQSETVAVPENADVQDQPKVEETAGKETDEKKKKIWFWCKSCSIAATKQQNEPPKTASTSMIITPPPQSETLAVPEIADVQDQQKVDETVEAKETGEKKKKAKCEICNIPQYTEQMMEAHRLERMHKVMLKRQQRALKKQQYELQAVAEDSNVVTVPAISLDADTGEKVKGSLLR